MNEKNVSISCRGIQKSYGEGENQLKALKGIDLDIYENELTLLVGPSGSGKSTLLSIITTILTPDEGELILLDKKLLKLSDKDRSLFCQQNLGIVFQSLFLVPTLNVLENIMLPLLIGGMKEVMAKERAFKVLQEVGLEKRKDFSPQELSKGQQQRIAIARALANDARIIVCDEPTSALDQEAGHGIMELLHQISSNKNKTVLVVTHDVRIFSFANRIVHLNDGLIINQGKS